MNARPDVSVIVAVYNVMPYLTGCLNSLVEQSIGQDRMEIIAVDDGSTDGCAKELDRFAEQYPDTLKVVHQANSGGPAAPSNRALDMANGRYVYFVGADDYLGSEALERLVAAADENDSDVVIGKMVGVNGRFVHAGLFKETRHDITLAGSALPWSLSNCKLFRRELVERHQLRFPEDLPVGSDQPFTIEACVRARRISALADYDYYYAVRRTDSSNMTYGTRPQLLLEYTRRLIEATLGILEPGPDRDAVLRRQFTWEVAKHVGTRFLDYDPADREEICAQVDGICNAYLTDDLRGTIDVRRRVRLCLARRGAVDDICAAVRQDVAEDVPPTVLKDGRAFARYPGFDEDGPPDDCYELSGNLAKPLAAGTATTSVAWESDAGRGTGLAVTARVTLTGPDALDPAVLQVVAVPEGKDVAARRLDPGQEPVAAVERVTLRAVEDGTGTDVLAWIPVKAMLSACPSGVRKHRIRLHVRAAGDVYEISLPAADRLPSATVRGSHRGRFYRVQVTAGKKGGLLAMTTPVRPARAVGRRLRRLARSTRR